MKKSIIGILVLLTIGCATDYSKKSADEVAKNIQVYNSPFDKNITFIAPPITNFNLLGLNYTARLMAIKSKDTGLISNGIFVDFTYTGPNWLFFNAARLEGGISIPVTMSNQQVNNCSGSTGLCAYEETVTALLPINVLQGAKNGLKIMFVSKDGGQLIELPYQYVLGYLQGVGKLSE